MAASSSRWLIRRWRSLQTPRGEPAVAQHAAITFVRPGRVGEVLVADAVERMHAGRSGMYDVRISAADGELVAEFRGHTRTLRGKAEG